MKFLISIFVMLFLSTFAVAEQLPNLMGLGSITTESTSNGDPSFAQNLQKLSDNEGALLEWQRLAHISDGEAQVFATLQAARIAIESNQKTRARIILEQFITKSPENKKFMEALYLLSRTVPEYERQKVLNMMTSTNTQNLWTKEAIYYAVWDYAKENGVLPTRNYSDSRTQQLTRRLGDLKRHYPSKFIAKFLTIFPGSLMLWYGETIRGLLFFTLTCLTTWTLFFAFKQKQWPYLAWWTFLLFTIVITAQKQTLDEAQRVQKEDRLEAMNAWIGLHPKEPKE